MKIALLGYGKEGQAAEKYFKTKFNAEIDIFQDFTFDEIKSKDYSSYDIILRSPSVPPLMLKNESSITRYFFDHCPCPIIGVTATKGKGTTCTFIKSLLDATGADAYLVGNIGVPAIEVLDQLTRTSVVVYELSSFQLWDLSKSPHIAVLGQLEPDHLNVHNGYADYIAAKTNITLHQTAKDYLVYYSANPETTQIARLSSAIQVPYPFEISSEIRGSIPLPGEHNVNNAMAAIAAVASYKNISPDEYLRDHSDEIITGLKAARGLPHRLELVRELNGVQYYDDSFSTNPSSTRVAVNAFPDKNVVVIVGGRDKTDNSDLPELYEIISAPHVKKVILIGESGQELAERYHDSRFHPAATLEAAVTAARLEAEALGNAVVILSPSAASFDMFKNAYDRGDQYQASVNNLK